MARLVVDDTDDNYMVVLCVLKGGYKFCADLVECIKAVSRNTPKHMTVRVEFIRLKSYLVGARLLQFVMEPFDFASSTLFSIELYMQCF